MGKMTRPSCRYVNPKMELVNLCLAAFVVSLIKESTSTCCWGGCRCRWLETKTADLETSSGQLEEQMKSSEKRERERSVVLKLRDGAVGSIAVKRDLRTLRGAGIALRMNDGRRSGRRWK